MELLDKLTKEYGRDLFIKLKDPVFFIKNIIRGSEKIGMTPYQEEWIRLQQQYKRLNIWAFRSSGKTKTFIIDDAIFKAFTISGFKGVITAPSLPQSIGILKEVRDCIMTNEVLSTAVPSDKSMLWTKTHIELKNRSQIMCRPYSERVRSLHVNWVWADEGGEYQSSETFLGAFMPIVRAKDGGMTVLGTVKHSLDLLHKLRDNKEWETRIYPANLPYQGKTLWEWRYSDKTLEQLKKEMGNNIMFTREYFLKCMSADTQVYPAELIIPSFDYGDKFIDKPRPECVYYLSFDFALSGKTGADYSAYFVYEVNKENLIKIVRIERYKGLSSGAQKQRMKELYNTFNPVLAAADEGNIGKSFLQDMRDMGIPMVGFNFQGRRNELLEVFRGAFELNFQNGEELPFEKKKFLICRDREDYITTNLVNIFQNELESFNVIFKSGKTGDVTGRVAFESTQPHDDTVMSAAIGYWYARSRSSGTTYIRRGSSYKTSNSLFRSTR